MLVQIAIRDAAAVEYLRPLMAIARPGWATAQCSAQPRQPTMFPHGVRSLSAPPTPASQKTDGGSRTGSSLFFCQTTTDMVVVGDEIARLVIAANCGLLSETSQASSV